MKKFYFMSILATTILVGAGCVTSAELVHQESLSLAPQELKTFTFAWNQDGVRSGDVSGTTYELYLQLVNEDGYFMQESTPVTVTLTIPDL